MPFSFYFSYSGIIRQKKKKKSTFFFFYYCVYVVNGLICVFVTMRTAQFLPYRPDKDWEGARSQKSCCSCDHPAAQRPQQQNHTGKHAACTSSHFTPSTAVCAKWWDGATEFELGVGLRCEDMWSGLKGQTGHQLWPFRTTEDPKSFSWLKICNHHWFRYCYVIVP